MADMHISALAIRGKLDTMLRELYGSEAERALWMSSPHPLLDNELPLTLVQRGQGQRVVMMLQQMLDGNYI